MRCLTPLVIFGLAIFAAPAFAIPPQALLAAPPQAAPADAPIFLSAPLAPEEVDPFLATLTDEQARARLRETLKAEAAERQRSAAEAAAAPRREGLAVIAAAVEERVERLVGRLKDARQQAEILDYYGTVMLMALTNQQGWPAVGRGGVVLLLLLAVGGSAEWGLRRSLLAVQRRIAATLAETPIGRLGNCASLLLFDALGLFVFALVAVISSFVFYAEHDPMRAVLITTIFAVVLVRAIYAVATRTLRGPARIFPLSETLGRSLVRWLTGIATVIAIAISMPATLVHLGLGDALGRILAQPLIALIILLTVLMVWRTRAKWQREAPSVGAGEGGQLAPAAPTSVAYYVFATAYAFVVFAAGAQSSLLGERGHAILSYVSLLIVIAAPSLVGLLGRTLDQLAPPAPFAPEHWAENVAQAGRTPAPVREPLRQRLKTALLAGAYALLLAGAFMLLIEAWQGGSFDFLTGRVGQRIGTALANIYLIALIAFVLWQAIEAWAQRHLAEDESEPSGGETEEGFTTVRKRSRMGTLAPLLRAAAAILLVTFAVMFTLSSLGINIAPLLAGAGVVGLAVGFGAQTLVRDILSGVFFLVDDAFRVGEYIEIDNQLRGEVERLTIRSMQLRHHRGPLLTLPYGNLRAVINHNRDFAIFKQEFRVPYDTDLEKVRKIIKKIGQELLQDPEWGPKFLQPLKSQGVIRIEESALIIRTKFVCKPREQFVLRRIVFQRVQEAFHAAGIEFAFRKVHVQVDRDADEETVRKAAAGAAIAAAVADEQAPSKAALADRP
jgi:small-conductance mechanosensitive channel